MRTNALKRALAQGRRVCGVLVDVLSEDLVELFGHVGFDFAVLDAQHGGVDAEQARGLLRAAELTGLATLVRVPRNDAAEILRYLDAGAGGIIVPNVASGADVAAAVSAMKYPPEGRRGAAGRSRAAGYGLTQSPAEWFAGANAEVLFMPLVEDPEALDHLPGICAAPGVARCWPARATCRSRWTCRAGFATPACRRRWSASAPPPRRPGGPRSR